MILNKAQAEALYSAMCALNNVSHTYLRVSFDPSHGNRISVSETDSSLVITLHAFQGNPAEQRQEFESYDTQAAFAAAYDLI